MLGECMKIQFCVIKLADWLYVMTVQSICVFIAAKFYTFSMALDVAIIIAGE